MLTAIVAAGLLMSQAAPRATSQPPPTPAPAIKPAKPKKPKMICTEETQSDSFISKRVCRTPEQVEAERQASRNTADDTLDRAQTCRGPGC